MEWGEFSLSTFLASGVISAALTKYFDWRQKKEDYKQSYYKLILDKRLSAYEDVQEIISSFNFVITDNRYNDVRNRKYFTCLSTLTRRKETISIIKKALCKKMWLSKDLSIEISKLNTLVIRTKAKDENEYRKMVIQEYLKIIMILNIINDIYKNDLMELYKVHEFLKNANVKKKYKVQRLFHKLKTKFVS